MTAPQQSAVVLLPCDGKSGVNTCDLFVTFAVVMSSPLHGLREGRGISSVRPLWIKFVFQAET